MFGAQNFITKSPYKSIAGNNAIYDGDYFKAILLGYFMLSCYHKKAIQVPGNLWKGTIERVRRNIFC